MKSRRKVNIQKRITNTNTNTTSTSTKTDKDTQVYKIIIFGDEKVGKTQIINVYNGLSFEDKYLSTFAIDYKIKNTKSYGQLSEIQLIEIASKGNFNIEMNQRFFKGSDAFIIVFDVSSKESLENVDSYVKTIQLMVKKHKNKTESEEINFTNNEDKKLKSNIYVVGNKCDLFNRKCNEIDGVIKAKQYDGKYMEVSAKNNINIDKLFFTIIKDINILRKEKMKKIDSNSNSIRKTDTNNTNTNSNSLPTNNLSIINETDSDINNNNGVNIIKKLNTKDNINNINNNTINYNNNNNGNNNIKKNNDDTKKESTNEIKPVENKARRCCRIY